MTRQEIFDKVCRHLLTQNKKSERLIGDGPTKECMYRGEDGCKCAMGIFITDEEYEEKMEGVEIAAIVLHFDIEALVKADLMFCNTLQGVHDKVDVENWPRELKMVGVANNLRLDVLSGGL